MFSFDVKRQCIMQLNHSIEVGLLQLQTAKKVLATEAYQRLKRKINEYEKRNLLCDQ